MSTNFINAIENNIKETNPLEVVKKALKTTVQGTKWVVNVVGTTGIAGFQFNVPQKELIELKAKITDNYTDINNAVQDHIAHEPIRITLEGLCGDYFYSVHQIRDFVSKITPTLSLVKQFLPKWLPATSQKISKRYNNLIYSSDKFQESEISATRFNSIDVWQIFQSVYKIKSVQTRAYLFLKALWASKARFSVETSLENFDDMVIEGIQITRMEYNDIINFRVVMKQFSTTQSLYTNLDEAVGRRKQQTSEMTDKGINKGKKENP